MSRPENAALFEEERCDKRRVHARRPRGTVRERQKRRHPMALRKGATPGEDSSRLFVLRGISWPSRFVVGPARCLRAATHAAPSAWPALQERASRSVWQLLPWPTSCGRQEDTVALYRARRTFGRPRGLSTRALMPMGRRHPAAQQAATFPAADDKAAPTKRRSTHICAPHVSTCAYPNPGPQREGHAKLSGPPCRGAGVHSQAKSNAFSYGRLGQPSPPP